MSTWVRTSHNLRFWFQFRIINVLKYRNFKLHTICKSLKAKFKKIDCTISSTRNNKLKSVLKSYRNMVLGWSVQMTKSCYVLGKITPPISLSAFAIMRHNSLNQVTQTGTFTCRIEYKFNHCITLSNLRTSTKLFYYKFPSNNYATKKRIAIGHMTIRAHVSIKQFYLKYKFYR